MTEYVSTTLTPGDTREPAVLTMLENIPSGRFAVVTDPNKGYRFYRIARPVTGKYKGWLKIQRRVSDHLNTQMLVMPTGRYFSYASNSAALMDDLLLIIADWQGAALAFAREIGDCSRCGASLTDHRSRHYGIGPECEKHWPGMLERIDELHDGKSFEVLLAEGTVNA